MEVCGNRKKTELLKNWSCPDTLYVHIAMSTLPHLCPARVQQDSLSSPHPNFLSEHSMEEKHFTLVHRTSWIIHHNWQNGKVTSLSYGVTEGELHSGETVAIHPLGFFFFSFFFWGHTHPHACLIGFGMAWILPLLWVTLTMPFSGACFFSRRLNHWETILETY